MKLFVYSYRQQDEQPDFDAFSRETGIAYAATHLPPTPETAALAEGCDAVSVFLTPVGREVLERWAGLSVTCVCARTIGYDYIDLDTCRSLGLRVCHALYPPEAVANYSLMLAMMLLRQVPYTMQSMRMQDYTLRGKLGRDLSSCTLGVVGTGRIGCTLARNAHAMGADVLGFDQNRNPEAAAFLRYAGLEQLFRESDVLSLHCPSTAENYHLINQKTIGRMKEGALLVNTARGDLIDTDALIAGLESGRLGGAALDVLEEEHGLFYQDLSGVPIANRRMAVLRSFPNVILTPHIAFYSAESIHAMVGSVFSFLAEAALGDSSCYEVKL
ncbi:MAG: lactate dehydrogenase [Clostridiales bacterium]|nr:lactate dehydrogenase [Clostridiales bacterium]